jgi:hypothetical protein
MFKYFLTICIFLFTVYAVFEYYINAPAPFSAFSAGDPRNYSVFIDYDQNHLFQKKSKLYLDFGLSNFGIIGQIDSMYSVGKFKRLKISITYDVKVPLGSKFIAHGGCLVEESIELAPSNSKSFCKPNSVFGCEWEWVHVCL